MLSKHPKRFTNWAEGASSSKTNSQHYGFANVSYLCNEMDKALKC